MSSKTAVVTGPMASGLLGELARRVAQPFELGLDVIDAERGVRDAVLGQRRLEWLGGRMPVGLEQQLGSLRVLAARRRSAIGASPSGMSSFFSNPSTSV